MKLLKISLLFDAYVFGNLQLKCLSIYILNVCIKDALYSKVHALTLPKGQWTVPNIAMAGHLAIKQGYSVSLSILFIWEGFPVFNHWNFPLYKNK